MRILLLLLLALPQEKLDVSRHPWMRHAAGASVSYTLTQELGALKQEGRLTHKLKEVTAAGYTVGIQVSQLAGEQTLEEKDSVPVKVGEEKLTVAGKELACAVWESKGSRGPAASAGKYWLAPGVPVAVRIVASVEGQEELELAAVAFDEKVSAAGKEYACVKLQGKSKGPFGEAETTLWASDQVPGGLVRMIGKGKVQGVVATTTLELQAVAVKK
jgi:hypothetical protein